MQLRLAQLNAQRLRPMLPEELGFEDVVAEAELRVMETHWIDAERSVIAAQVETAPCSPAGIVAAIEAHALRSSRPWSELRTLLTQGADLRDARWVVGQELGIEALIAGLEVVVPVGLPRAVQHAFAVRNERALRAESWTARLARVLGVGADEPMVAEALALANLMVGLASNRRFAFHAVGALAAQALAADDVGRDLSRVLRRAGRVVPSAIEFEADNRRAWVLSVLGPLFHEHRGAARAIVEGGVLRLRAGARRWRRYARCLREARRT